MSNKTFWKIVKPFLAYQPSMASDGFSIDKDEDAITDEKVLVEFLNENYRIIVEISPGDKPSTLRKCKDCAQDDATVEEIKQNAVLIPMSKKLKYQGFELAYVNAKNINQIIKSVNVNKAKGPDGISAKFAKISADIIIILQILSIRIFLIIRILKMLKLQT